MARHPDSGLRRMLLGILVMLALLLPAGAPAATRVMCLGDSITHGHLGHASYRYFLWFRLVGDGLDVDLVGRQDDVHGGDPDPTVYPHYDDLFDRDHEGHWGLRTDEIIDLVPDAVAETLPDIVLIHLGTNDVGQRGNHGIEVADTNLRLIIGMIRGVNPGAVILLARIIPIGEGTFYELNAHLVPVFNSVIDGIAADLTTPQSPVLLVDHFAGFDTATMMLDDGIHPNPDGEQFMAARWAQMLEAVLTTGVGVGEAPPAAPAIQAFPNPFNPQVTVRYRVPDDAGAVSVRVLNVAGELVRVLAGDVAPASGWGRCVWDGRDRSGLPCPSGVYLVHMQMGAATQATPITLCR